jgi:hypothetical protein
MPRSPDLPRSLFNFSRFSGDCGRDRDDLPAVAERLRVDGGELGAVTTLQAVVAIDWLAVSTDLQRVGRDSPAVGTHLEADGSDVLVVVG